MASRDSIGKTIFVALALCIVCSVLVSTVTVNLRPMQTINKALDKKRNILQAAGLLEEGADIETLYQNIEAKVIDISTGEYVDVDGGTYDQRRAAKDPATSVAVATKKDIANIKRQAKQASVYLVRQKGKIKKVILPVHGLGLWSTLYGFIALDAKNLSTIKGLVYYEHAETPGLGGEVDNPSWKALWNGKEAFNEKGEVRIKVIRGKVIPARLDAKYQVDGLSGATITSRGVSNMLQYWLGDAGFGTYLAKLKERGV